MGIYNGISLIEKVWRIGEHEDLSEDVWNRFIEILNESDGVLEVDEDGYAETIYLKTDEGVSKHDVANMVSAARRQAREGQDVY